MKHVCRGSIAHATHGGFPRQVSVQETSLDVYYRKVLPLLGKKQREVYEALLGASFSLTNMEVARKLGWSINRVTPRVLELRKKDVLLFNGVRRCRVTGNHAMTWKCKV